MRKMIFVMVIAAGLAVVAAVPAAAQSGGACQLNGTANFTPPLTNTAGSFSYDFGAALSSCQSNIPGAPTAGSVQVGKVYTAATGEQFQEPRATGSGSCANGTTQGIAFSFWNDGTLTIINYTTNSAAAAVDQQGTVVSTYTLPAINPQVGQPTSITLTTTRYAGDTAQGALTFQADPTQCSGSGVSSATVSGLVGIGTIN